MSDPEDVATMEALERYQAQGSDLSRPMEIDFFVSAPTEESAESVAREADSRGFSVKIEVSEASGEWTCYCTKTLIPSYANVRSIERELDAVARPFGGRADGFGSFGNAIHSS